MANTIPKTSHLERTATEPRNTDLHTVVIRDIQSVNNSIRLFRLEIPAGISIKFLAGQWLDTYVPSEPRAGGFTITSPPSKAHGDITSSSAGDDGYRYLELAVQRSPTNPAAAFLFRPVDELLGTNLRVRVGGSFVFPPPSVPTSSIRRIVFIAGGVGINPLVSMVSHIAELKGRLPPNAFDTNIQFLYTTRLPLEGHSEILDSTLERLQNVLFLGRLAAIWAEGRVQGSLRLFLTGKSSLPEGEVSFRGVDFETRNRRIGLNDLQNAIGRHDDKSSSLAYICGVPGMTDEFVKLLTCHEGIHMDSQRVFFEKWW